MKHNVLIFVAMLAFLGCGKSANLPEVTLEWFNLGTNQIWVTEASGIPIGASPGRLMPSLSENQLDVSASSFSEIVHIEERIVIKWMDNGKQGWPGGVNPPGSVPPGVAHEAEFSRDALGLPAKLEKNRIRFTYLGNDKWRIVRLNGN